MSDTDYDAVAGPLHPSQVEDLQLDAGYLVAWLMDNPEVQVPSEFRDAARRVLEMVNLLTDDADEDDEDDEG